MKTRIAVSLATLSLLSAASAAHATGYYLVVYDRASMPGSGGANGFAGFSTSIVNGFNSGVGVTDRSYAGLADFNGDSIPEVVTASSSNAIVDVWNFNTHAVLANFGLPGAPAGSGGPITITAPTITVNGSTTGVFNYAPGGTPTPTNPFLDLDGDGVADSIAFNPGTLQITLTNGATSQQTTFFPNFVSAPTNVQIITWTPAPAPEPASLTLLTLAAPLLLKRRR